MLLIFMPVAGIVSSYVKENDGYVNGDAKEGDVAA